MATFSSQDKQRIWQLYGLDRDELLTGSSLSVALQQVEDFDTNHGTTLVLQVKEYLDAIDEIDTQIKTQQESTGYSFKFLEVVGEYRLDRDVQNSPIAGYLERRQEVLGKISQILKYYPSSQQGRLLRG